MSNKKSLSISWNGKCKTNLTKQYYNLQIYYVEIFQGVEIMPGFVLVVFKELLEPEYQYYDNLS